MSNLPSTRYGKTKFQGVLRVPADYVFGKDIDTFLKDSGESVHLFGTAVSDTNFSSVSNRFSPGETYRVEVVPIIEYMIHCQRCLEDLNKEKDLLFFGAQGLVLFAQYYPYEIPKGHLLSFDLTERLFHNGSVEQLPYMYRGEERIEFSTINFWSSLGSRSYSVLLFYKH